MTTPHPSRPVTHLVAALVAIYLAAATSPSHANETEPASWSVSAGTGMDGRSAVRIARQWPWQARWLEGRLGYLTGYWEASLMLTRNDDSPGPFDDGASTVGALAIAPVLRWQLPGFGGSSDKPHLRPYIDLGTGVAVLSDKDIRKGAFRSRRMGSYGQFENRVNIGAHIGQRWSLAYRQLHYSNADIASRNDGLDLFMLALTRRF